MNWHHFWEFLDQFNPKIFHFLVCLLFIVCVIQRPWKFYPRQNQIYWVFIISDFCVTSVCLNLLPASLPVRFFCSCPAGPFRIRPCSYHLISMEPFAPPLLWMFKGTEESVFRLSLCILGFCWEGSFIKGELLLLRKVKNECNKNKPKRLSNLSQWQEKYSSV